MRILVAQIDTTVGDISGNTNAILRSIKLGQQLGLDLVLFPELTLSGYPPDDFLLLPHFHKAIQEHLQHIIQATENITAIVGLPRQITTRGEKTISNSAAIIQNKNLLGFYDKVLLPTYDVFDEMRYFEPGSKIPLWDIKGKKVAITICEDIWQHSGFLKFTQYKRDPILELKEQKPDLVLNLSASPYSYQKLEMRCNVGLQAAKTLGCPLILCNLVGGNDSLIFDGYSFYADSDGLLQLGEGFCENKLLIDTDLPPIQKAIEINKTEELFKALVLGVRDYFAKFGFKKACLGLSGGIDSAVVACIAVAALGPQNVLALGMPSRYSAKESMRDSNILVQNLGITYQEISIEDPFDCFLKVLKPSFEGKKEDSTEENLQARIRGMLLMAFSNKFGYIVLSTGNKSEIAMGYSTLYGDLCGGLAVISDVTKQQIYELAKWINRKREIIPLYTISRPPSAELRENQKDTDSLPEYNIIDDVLTAYVEDHLPPDQIVQKFNYSADLVDDIIKRIHRNEYKRRQAPPGLRVSEKSFSVGRRFPIVQRWV